MGSVFVLNSHATHGLEAIRSLGAQGLNVTAGSSRRVNSSRLSRFADRYVTYPAPEEKPELFVQAVEDELDDGNYDMLLPINEATVETIVKHRSRFERDTTVPFPPYEKLSIGLDKRRTVEAARKADIPRPTTLFSDETSLASVDQTLEYPLVVKPQRGSGRIGVSICESYDELERVTRRTTEEHGPVLFQEYVPDGGERGVYTLYGSSGNPIGRTVQRRLRSSPPEGGSSTYRETIDDPTIVSLTDEFLTSLDWKGLAMAEFRIDARTGEPKLMEINPRPWGSLALSTYAGVDFPYLLYQMSVGEEPEPVLDYDVGVRARCLFTDGKQVFEREDRLRALAEFLTPSGKPCRHDILSIRDPLPVLGQFAYLGVGLRERLSRTADAAEDSTNRSPEAVSG